MAPSMATPVPAPNTVPMVPSRSARLPTCARPGITPLRQVSLCIAWSTAPPVAPPMPPSQAPWMAAERSRCPTVC